MPASLHHNIKCKHLAGTVTTPTLISNKREHTDFTCHTLGLPACYTNTQQYTLSTSNKQFANCLKTSQTFFMPNQHAIFHMYKRGTKVNHVTFARAGTLLMSRVWHSNTWLRTKISEVTHTAGLNAPMQLIHGQGHPTHTVTVGLVVELSSFRGRTVQ